jgi:hypothetical protein
MQAAKKALHTEITGLVNERKELQSASKPSKQKLDAAKEHLDCVNSQFKTKDKQLRAKIEAILKTYGIDQGAHHGGDMVGNSCRKYLMNSESIMSQIKELLCLVGEESGMSRTGIMELQKRCDTTASLLTHYDGFFSRMRIPKEEVTDTSIEEARTAIGNGM